MNAPLLFALDASRAYGAKAARALDLTLAAHEERMFEDGERMLRPLAEVRGLMSSFSSRSMTSLPAICTASSAICCS